MCLLSAVLWLPDGESRPIGRTDSVDLDVGDACARRPVADGAFEAFYGVGIPFCVHLDSTVRPVPDPSVDALAVRRGVGEHAEADTVHAAVDKISTRDTHE